MRVCLTVLVWLVSAAAVFAESQAEFFASGMKYFLRHDYSAAREMFSHSAEAPGEYGALSMFYLASIAAFNGDPSACDLFERSLKNPPKGSLNKVAAQYAKFALANGEYARFLKAAAPIVESGNSDSLVDWYYAEALYDSGEKAKAVSFWRKAVDKYFCQPDAVGADVFVDSACSGGKLAAEFPPASLPDSSPAARARAEILKGEKISQPHSQISAYALVKLAESGAKTDAKLLAEAVYECRDAPFAWRGYLALSRGAAESKNYADAETYARDAETLAPPDSKQMLEVYMALGDALRLEKKYPDALYYYQKIFMDRKSLGEMAAESLYKAGLCWYEQGEWGKAHAYFERVFVSYFNFEYWGARAYYYDARALFSLGLRRDANATLVEYFRRAKDRKSDIYRQARAFYEGI